MSEPWMLVSPETTPMLEPEFRPAVLAHRAFLEAVEATGGGEPLVLGLERGDGSVSRYETRVFRDAHPKSEANLFFAERLLKFLLWQRGAYRVYVGGSPEIARFLKKCYAPGGLRAFDAEFMGRDVYEKDFEVVHCAPNEVPDTRETASSLGRHLNGCRIGFDLGASDRKVSAVMDGNPVFSEEVIWEPAKHADPAYHYNEIMAALRSAAAHLPRVDAIGGSSAGVYVNNRPMVASLFRAVPRERYGEIRDLFVRISREMGVPLVVVNDGEVTALAGSMALEDHAVLGVALGSSEAGGYVTPEGQITGWLNELAFCPVDYNPDAAIDEWSKDFGVGAKYFSQQCVFRLCNRAGIQLPANITDAERLKFVQEKLDAGHPGAQAIWRTMGVFLGYGLAYYAHFYQLRHVLVLGRCTSGRGGDLLVSEARGVLEREFPDIAAAVRIHLPDEKIRRVGQSIAAASLPDISQAGQ